MIALTQKDVLAHEFVVPWSEPYQVEQDLLLCLAMRAIFEDRFLSHQVAMRGGTVLHKVHLAPATRYSQDIDLVAVGDRPEGHIRKATSRAPSSSATSSRYSQSDPTERVAKHQYAS